MYNPSKYMSDMAIIHCSFERKMKKVAKKFGNVKY